MLIMKIENTDSEFIDMPKTEDMKMASKLTL
jgi:hypothetical protein